MKKLLLVVLVLILNGCVAGTGARMVRFNGASNSAYAPVNENTSRGGTTKYAAKDGSVGRENTYKLMSNACNGKYKITNETTKNETLYYYNSFTRRQENVSVDFVYIDFACE